MKLRFETICILTFFLLFGLLGCSNKSGESSTSESFSYNELSDSSQSNEGGKYSVQYYPDIDSTIPSENTTEAVAGVETKILTLDELGFSKSGYVFEGWRLYREVDNKWFLKDRKGNSSWRELENGELPSGYCFDFRADGATLIKPATEGVVKLFAQWGGKSFDAVYHLDNITESAGPVTEVVYGEPTPAVSVSDLGYETGDAVFKGWHLFREVDNKWSAIDKDGNTRWVSLKDGHLPEGYSYVLYSDEFAFVRAATSGVVHAYAQWSGGTFTVLYHQDEKSDASELTTEASYGASTPAKSVDELGFTNGNAEFAGWILYREIDNTWSLKDSSGNRIWATVRDGKLPDNYTYCVYDSDLVFVTAAPSGVIHAYAQWSE